MPPARTSARRITLGIGVERHQDTRQDPVSRLPTSKPIPSNKPSLSTPPAELSAPFKQTSSKSSSPAAPAFVANFPVRPYETPALELPVPAPSTSQLPSRQEPFLTNTEPSAAPAKENQTMTVPSIQSTTPVAQILSPSWILQERDEVENIFIELNADSILAALYEEVDDNEIVAPFFYRSDREALLDELSNGNRKILYEFLGDQLRCNNYHRVNGESARFFTEKESRQDKVWKDKAEIHCEPYEGNYPATTFFQAFDRECDQAFLTHSEKLASLPRFLEKGVLTLFRKLRLDTQSYMQARQTLIHLYPETNEVSYAKFFAIKLAGNNSLEDFYRNKCAMLGLPQEVLLETLTEGFPASDQRLTRVAAPKSLSEWFDVVSRCWKCIILNFDSGENGSRWRASRDAPQSKSTESVHMTLYTTIKVAARKRSREKRGQGIGARRGEEAHIAKLTEERDLERQKVVQVRTRAEKAESDISNIEQEYINLKGETNKLEGQQDKRKIEDLQFRLEEEALIRMKTSDSRVAQLQEETFQKDEQIAQLETQLEHYRKESTTLLERLRSSQCDHSILQDDLDKEAKSIDVADLQEENLKKDEQISELGSQLAQQYKENNPLKIHTMANQVLFVRRTNLPCLFCDKDNHLSQNCFKAAKMLASDRLKRARDAKVCFKCLRKNHLKRNCRSFVRCKRCQGPNFEIMCRGASHRQEKFKLEDNHLSQNCFKAAKMLESGRLKKARDAKVCFKCSRKNHLKRDCRYFVRCKRFQGPHFQIMCRGTSHGQGNLNWKSDNRSHNSSKVKVDKEPCPDSSKVKVDKEEPCPDCLKVNAAKEEPCPDSSKVKAETSAQMVIALLAAQQRVTSLRKLVTIGIRDPAEVIELHVFGDSGKGAYATDAFLRGVKDGVVHASLMAAKTRVAPLESIANIVDWRFVLGAHSPADLPSRGCYAPQFILSKWWEGPQWLRESEDKWPKQKPTPNEEQVLEEKKGRWCKALLYMSKTTESVHVTLYTTIKVAARKRSRENMPPIVIKSTIVPTGEKLCIIEASLITKILDKCGIEYKLEETVQSKKRTRGSQSDDSRSPTRSERNLKTPRMDIDEKNYRRKKPLKVVLKGVTTAFKEEDVVTELVSMGFTEVIVKRLHRQSTKIPMNIVLVELPKNEQNKRIYGITKSKQLPPKCANCGEAHTANYRGCPKFPKPQQQQLKPPRQNSPNTIPEASSTKTKEATVEKQKASNAETAKKKTTRSDTRRQQDDALPNMLGPFHSTPQRGRTAAAPPSPCRHCGGPHWNADCHHKKGHLSARAMHLGTITWSDQRQTRLEPSREFRPAPAAESQGSDHKVVIPDTLTTDLLNTVHARYNHPGIPQMTRLISAQYYWKGMSKDIANADKNLPNLPSNGLCERLNATLTGKLRLLYLENPKIAWTKLVTRVTTVYNNTPHSVTRFPPSYLMFGTLPPELTEHLTPYSELDAARRIAHERTQAKHFRDKRTFDKHHKATHFEPGDLVLVKIYQHPNTGKLSPYFTGPYEILEIVSPNVGRINKTNLSLNRKPDTVHVNKLQYYNENIRYIVPPTIANTRSAHG
ncbi:hypothetical protein LAZ67_19002022 [Cordylochernes scorpioides]|uniref:Uncharacterized protein n=1 Tax=Cordylochernes scorpioides TaxID=51811 RepID=A0ABY6LLZ2_9ARAC|nr:hypothetical protein LAZ67_19002022 [Cordylochernes scorpioides]